jgi:hypothetical protein
MKKYYLVTDATAEEVIAKTGLDAHQTHMGALVERPPEFDLHGALAELDRAFNPNRCTCGAYAVIHRPSCPAGLMMT